MTSPKIRTIISALAAVAVMAVIGPAVAHATTSSTTTSGTASTYSSGSSDTRPRPGTGTTRPSTDAPGSAQLPKDAFAAHDGVSDDQCRKALQAYDRAVQNGIDLINAGKTAEGESWLAYARDLWKALESNCVLVH